VPSFWSGGGRFYLIDDDHVWVDGSDHVRDLTGLERATAAASLARYRLTPAEARAWCARRRVELPPLPDPRATVRVGLAALGLDADRLLDNPKATAQFAARLLERIAATPEDPHLLDWIAEQLRREGMADAADRIQASRRRR